MPIDVRPITAAQRARILATTEGHFADIKAREIAPAKLTKTLSAFANADGGELHIGIAEDKKKGERIWEGFGDPEAANGHIQAFETFFPLGRDFSYTFLSSEGDPGLVLQVAILKTRDVKSASDRIPYLRRGAQNLPVDTPDKVRRLELDKGVVSFETETLPVAPSLVTNSNAIIGFMIEVIPTSEPDAWLQKQQLLFGDKPTVAAALLFADEPQSLLPKRCGVKIYRYATRDKAGTRETLAGQPVTIEGCTYRQIEEAVKQTVAMLENLSVLGDAGAEKVSYLRATDKIQRDIEQYLHDRDWYYERRNSYWQNQGKPIERIVSPRVLAKFVRAIALGDPLGSLSSKSNVFRNDQIYRKIFNPKWSLAVFWAAVVIAKEIERLKLAAGVLPGTTDTKVSASVLPFASFVYVAQTLGRSSWGAEEVISVAESLDHARAKAVVEAVRECVARMGVQRGIKARRAIRKKSFFTELLASSRLGSPKVDAELDADFKEA